MERNLIEHPDPSGVRGPHLPLTKDLDIRHDGEPSPDPVLRRQTLVSSTELPFYHSTVFTTEAPELESYYHQGVERQYRVIERAHREHHQPMIGPQNREQSEGASLENGHSNNKIGSPSEGNIKVVKKENGFTQRELRQINENNVLGVKRSESSPGHREDDEYGDDYENLIKAGTITEFLKL